MTQRNVGRLSASMAPGIALGNGLDDTKLAGGKTKKVMSLIVGTVTNSATYTATVPTLSEEGVESTTTITYTADGSATDAEIIAGLLAAALSKADVVRRVLPYTVSGTTDRVFFEGRRVGDNFTVSDSDAKLSTATVTAASSGTEVEPGFAVCYASDSDFIEYPVDNSGAFTRGFFGVALRGDLEVESLSDENPVHQVGRAVPVRRLGEVVVVVEPDNNPAIGDGVYVRLVADGTKEIGMFVDADDGSNTVALTGAYWTDTYRGSWGTGSNKRTVASVYIPIAG